MAAYSIEVAQQLSHASFLLLDTIETTAQGKEQTALYLALLSAEISLKAALEAAGFPVEEIKKSGHDFTLLLKKIDQCTIIADINFSSELRISASQIRAVLVDGRYADATIGNLLNASNHQLSKYPNEIRYGDTIRHFPVRIMSDMSAKIIEWVKLNRGNIRRKVKNQ